MGKKILIIALITAFLSFPAFSEVENVKVGGQIRFRAYLYHRYDLERSTDTNDHVDYIEQRTRVYLASDLTENVFAKVTIQGVNTSPVGNQWEYSNVTSSNANSLIEGYVQLKDVFSTMGLDYDLPLDFKIGRQFFAYGKNFIISPVYSYDAIKATLNLDPWKVDLFTWKLDETSTSATGAGSNDDQDFYGIYAAYTGIADWIIEPYFLARKDRDKTGSDKRMTWGLRAVGKPLDGLDTWGEIAIQDGSDMGLEVSAMALWLGGKYTFKDVTYKPFVNLEYIYGSGDKDSSDNKDKAFDQLYEFTEFGYTYDPKVSNIHIIKAGLGCSLTDDLSLALNYYHYRQAKKATYGTYTNSGTSSTDIGDIDVARNGTDKDIGDEIDIVLNYRYTEDVSTQFYWAYFMPGDAFSSPTNKDAYSIRGQMIVNF